jgi:hypothetical protein
VFDVSCAYAGKGANNNVAIAAGVFLILPAVKFFGLRK